MSWAKDIVAVWAEDRKLYDRREMTIIPAVTVQEVLDLGLPDNDSEGSTIREYLVNLLEEVWNEGEGFSGKRPFGNSGWEMDLLIPLAEAGFISGHKDEEWGEWDFDSDDAGRELISKAIRSLAFDPS